jgi:1,4-dihydroxy-2-naphthoate octaprenyltransferase
LKPLAAALGGLACIALWAVLAFVLAIPSGWVHLPLAIGVVLMATAIILTEPVGRHSPTGDGESSSHQ